MKCPQGTCGFIDLLKSAHSARGKGLVWVGNLGEAAGVTGVQAVVHVGSSLYVEGDTF